MTPVRFPDWRPRLVAYLEEVRGRPFVYGTCDCAIFVAGSVEAMTGHDPAAEYRGRYGSLKEGLKLVGRQGLSDHVAVFSAMFEPIAPAFAGVGDIAVIGDVGTPALGLFDGETILVLREDGLGRIPRQAATQAYRVP